MKFIGINVKLHMQVYKNSQMYRVQSVAETWSRFILWKQQQNLHKINKTNIRHQQDRRVIPESRETSEPWDCPQITSWKELPGYSVGRGNLSIVCFLCKLRRQNSEFGIANTAEIHWIPEYQRKEGSTERTLEIYKEAPLGSS